MTPIVLGSSSAAQRQRWARRWLKQQREQAVGRPVIVVVPQLRAAGDLLHSMLVPARWDAEDGSPQQRGLFQLQRSTIDLLAQRSCEVELSRHKAVVATAAVRQALVVRVLHDQVDRLEYFAAVARTAGFARLLARTLDELRQHQVDASTLKQQSQPSCQELGVLLECYTAALKSERLVDRAELLMLAAASHLSQRCAVLIFDIELRYPVEAMFLEQLAGRTVAAAATVAAGDALSEQVLRMAWPALEWTSLEEAAEDPSDPSLGRLRRQLFARAPAPTVDVQHEHPSVSVFSAPSAPVEAVEIARRVVQLTRRGVAAEDVAVLLRQPTPYVDLLLESLQRAGLEAYAAEGAFRPDPAGRAFLLLLQCRLDGLSATRFAEYLSLGQVPTEPVVGGVQKALGQRPMDPLPDPELEQDLRPSASGWVAPARWERLIGDAAVIGGLQRWQRRLAGLRRDFARRLESLDDPQSAAGKAIERDRKELQALANFALPLLGRLDALPASATWGEWIEYLQPVALEALRRPHRVLALLEELRALGHVGPVDLQRVVDSLAARLSELRLPPPSQRYGRVYIGLAHEVRGRSFEAVFIPGLVERGFPQKVLQDPVLLDMDRARLSASAPRPALSVATDRRAWERLALHLAVGASRRQVTLSYPRMDLGQGQPRVPSFYLLEVLRAVRGALPDFEQLIREAAEAGTARLERPWPEQPEDAIDPQEYDLALLGEAQRRRRTEPGMAGYAGHLHDQPFLVGALRAHWQRGKPKLSGHDGLLATGQQALQTLVAHSLDGRPHSATSLERYARCPYQFFLHALLRLRPLQDLEPEGHQQLDPLTRGRLFHTVQFELFRQLREQGMLPLQPQSLSAARDRLQEVFELVEGAFREELAPALPVLWHQEMKGVLAELLGWLQREAQEGAHLPLHFEYAFGLPLSAQVDEGSRSEPARLPGNWLLRGAIDLVEQRADGTLRVTDYKTGRAPATVEGLQGGTSLQRVLYAMAFEALNAPCKVSEGRLYFCTQRGNYREFVLALDETVRARLGVVLRTIDGAIQTGVLPAVPNNDCQGCDYVRVCGRDAASRARRKSRDPRLAELRHVRGL